jgi:hypothetical protein
MPLFSGKRKLTLQLPERSASECGTNISAAGIALISPGAVPAGYFPRQPFGLDESVVGIFILLLPSTADLAEACPVALFPVMQRLRDLEVDPCPGLLNRRPASLQGFALKPGFKYAKLAYPIQVLEHQLEVLIENKQFSIGQRFSGHVVRR